MTSFSRRHLVISTLSAAAGAAVVSALGASGTLAQATPGASPAASPVATDTFPVTVPHVYGETVIEAPATRVVTIGWSTQDAVIALGVDPVGIPANTWGGDAEGFLPWTRTALEGRTLPKVLDITEIPFEDIAGLNPDLILAPYSGITQDEYDTLSKIAPTVAYPKVAWGTSWQDDQTITGKALGMSAAAEKLVSDTETLIASQTDKYPQLKGKTFAYGNMGDGTAFNFYTTTDARSLFLAGIGLEPSDFVKGLDAQAGENSYFVAVSMELANTVIADIVVMWFGSEDDYKKAQANTSFQAIPAVKEGRFAAVVGESLVMASSAFSVLSIPYMLDQFIPTLAAAADNVK
ncbi:MAG: iron-siderophore ABC transporter substrate-binding protein [Thermomicrobiales bacterium]